MAEQIEKTNSRKENFTIPLPLPPKNTGGTGQKHRRDKPKKQAGQVPPKNTGGTGGEHGGHGENKKRYFWLKEKKAEDKPPRYKDMKDGSGKQLPYSK